MSDVWPQAVKDLARKLDPDCWASYSGQPREVRRAVDLRRLNALNFAREQLREQLADAPPAKKPSSRFEQLLAQGYGHDAARKQAAREIFIDALNNARDGETAVLKRAVLWLLEEGTS